ncbi:hypothetical protein PR003_g18668 [Phytophthora rubi]|uniref:HRDC domain-containing protein n=2 Tax=Phytophthora rubi TaxID=129364 RepID=A0A6A4E3W9_9STRA|nr:hypothetical protein PR001_g18095 [Phytophthora rubi]KAE9316618.1 hypothetical protein PR003_g18668 [Phytophthora rubi]
MVHDAPHGLSTHCPFCAVPPRPISSGFKAGAPSTSTGTGRIIAAVADGRMRVKKLSVNRRHKPGDDEAAIGVAPGGDSDQRRWVSPTKPLPPGAAASGSSSGASSPTDVQQQQQHLGENSPLHFQTNNSPELFAQRGAGGAQVAAAMPAVDVVMQDDDLQKNPLRKAMVGKIVETLRALKPHAPEKVLAALPRLAQHMEKALYKTAKNEAEYCDPSTLQLRIARIQESNAKRLLAQQQHTPEHSSNANAPLKPLTEEQAASVFQHLQSWRQKLVNMYGVAPWDILPNPTLAKVALYMPSTEQELAACGVGNEQLARFGSSLVQELQRLRGPAPTTKPANRPIKAKQPRKPSPAKRGSSEPLAASNKKRRNGEAARLAPAAPNFNSTTLMTPAPLLPAVNSLPTLLPTVSMMPGGVTSSNAMAMKQTQFTPTAVRLSPAPISQQPFFARLQPQPPQQQQPQQPQQQGSPSPGAQESHMHLLAQGAGQLSKQQSGKSPEAYEQELQSLRWMLHQSQEERSRLEAEVQHLRAQLQGVNGSK